MKTFWKSAFGLNLIVVLMFLTMTILGCLANVSELAMFFGICTFLFLMILPACSTKD